MRFTFLGHSLGLTDKALLSEILNSEKCKKIRFFKRTDIKRSSKPYTIKL